jgi:hypothetical protein
VNFNIEIDLLEEVGDIAFWKALPTWILQKAVHKFTELDEKKNGNIRARPKGRGFENL